MEKKIRLLIGALAAVIGDKACVIHLTGGGEARWVVQGQDKAEEKFEGSELLESLDAVVSQDMDSEIDSYEDWARDMTRETISMSCLPDDPGEIDERHVLHHLAVLAQLTKR